LRLSGVPAFTNTPPTPGGFVIGDVTVISMGESMSDTPRSWELAVDKLTEMTSILIQCSAWCQIERLFII
jgi:hypothetical protein